MCSASSGILAVSYTHLDVYKRQVQTLYSFPEGDGVQLTTAAYYTTSGRSIHGQGVTPDIEVALAADASVVFHAPDAQTDAQLQAALAGCAGSQ